MSYLRSISNPEGLYVVDSGNKGTIEFLNAGDVLSMARYIFDYLMMGWIGGREEIHYRGASVCFKKDEKSYEGDWKIHLTYKGWKWPEKRGTSGFHPPEDYVMKMWGVTWSFIVHSHEKYYEKQMRRFNQ